MAKTFEQALCLAFIVVLISVQFASAQQMVIDLDARGGYYSAPVQVRARVTERLYVSIKQYDDVELTIAPTVASVKVVVKDPDGRIVRDTTVSEKTTIPLSIDVKGTWAIELMSDVGQTVYVDIYAPPPTPPPTPPPPQPFIISPEFLAALIGGVVVVVVAVVGVLVLRRKPAPPPAPVPAQPQPPAPTPAGGETVVLDRRAAALARETEIMLATLELPDGNVIPVTSPRQIFGRADFERYVKPDVLNYISRRHFMISLEPGGFFIEDLGSANGTTVNDSDIRGKGKVPLKPGDVIGVGGVLKVKFRAG